MTALLLIAGAPAVTAAGDVAEDILARSIERYNAGELQPAIGGISAALRGRLSGAQLAKAYYYRGLAYRKAGEPGSAIIDLTRALDYSGLSDADRASASENLQVAYQEAGISASERVVIAPAGGDQPKAAKVDGVTTTKSVAAPLPVINATASIDAPPAVPGATTAGKASGPWQTKTMSPAPSAAQPAARTQPQGWAADRIAMAPLPMVPATTKAAATALPSPPEGKRPQAARGASPPAAALPVPPFVTQVAADPVPVPVAVPTAATADVVLLIGEANSRSEAFALAVRLTSQRGAELGPRRPRIAETRLADTAIYRLQLGPFSDAAQALALCRSLRDSGYACVTQ